MNQQDSREVQAKKIFKKILLLYENMNGKRMSTPAFYDDLQKWVDYLFQKEFRYNGAETEMTLQEYILQDLELTQTIMRGVQQLFYTTYTAFHTTSIRPLSYENYETFMKICHECGIYLGNTQMAQLHKETEAEYNNHNKPIQQDTVTPPMNSQVHSQPAEQKQWNETISSLKKRDDDLSSRISSVQSTIRDLKITVDANQQSYSFDRQPVFDTLTKHSQEIRSLTASNSNTETQIKDLNTEILSLQGQIKTLTDQVQTLNTWAEKPWYNRGQISATSQNSLHTFLTDLHKLSEP
jgi:hypothetical protein